MSILSQSQKIKKTAKLSSQAPKTLEKMRIKALTSPNDEQVDELFQSGYDTFANPQKEDIMEFLRRKVIEKEISHGNYSFGMNSRASFDCVSFLEKYGHETFNNFLKEIVPRYKPEMPLEKERLTRLRRQVKNWFKKQGKPEKRGNPLILDDELPGFLQILKKTIQTCKNRNFDEFRLRVLPDIEEIHKKRKTKTVIKGQIFSKHFWSDFTGEHPEIKELWKKLPRSKKVEASSSHSTSACDENLASPPLSSIIDQDGDLRDQVPKHIQSPCQETSPSPYFMSQVNENNNNFQKQIQSNLIAEEFPYLSEELFTGMADFIHQQENNLMMDYLPEEENQQIFGEPSSIFGEDFNFLSRHQPPTYENSPNGIYSEWMDRSQQLNPPSHNTNSNSTDSFLF